MVRLFLIVVLVICVPSRSYAIDARDILIGATVFFILSTSPKQKQKAIVVVPELPIRKKKQEPTKKKKPKATRTHIYGTPSHYYVPKFIE